SWARAAGATAKTAASAAMVPIRFMGASFARGHGLLEGDDTAGGRGGQARSAAPRRGRVDAGRALRNPAPETTFSNLPYHTRQEDWTCDVLASAANGSLPPCCSPWGPSGRPGYSRN